MEKQLYQIKKEAELRKQKNRRFLRGLRQYSIVIIVLSAIIFGSYFALKISGPQGEDFSRAITIMENIGHIPVGSRLPEYTSDPPTSGPHYGQTARSGFRDEEIPDQYIIHNLEHGDVWISYHPRVSDEVKNKLKKFGAAKVIVAPREANEFDIALAAWGRLDAFNIEDDQVPTDRISDFIKRYLGKGPERVPGASGGI